MKYEHREIINPRGWERWKFKKEREREGASLDHLGWSDCWYIHMSILTSLLAGHSEFIHREVMIGQLEDKQQQQQRTLFHVPGTITWQSITGGGITLITAWERERQLLPFWLLLLVVSYPYMQYSPSLIVSSLSLSSLFPTWPLTDDQADIPINTVML